MVEMKLCLLFGCLVKKIKPCDCTLANPPVVPAAEALRAGTGGSQLAAGWVPKALRNISYAYIFRRAKLGADIPHLDH